MFDVSALEVKDLHSCMPTAVNIYFGVCVFTSMADFDLKQRRLIADHRKKYPAKFSTHFLSVIRHHKLFHRKYLFVARHATLGNMPSKTPSRSDKTIIEYWSEIKKEGHCEAVYFKKGKIQLIRKRKGNRLPFSSFTFDQMLKRCTKSTHGFLNMFYYTTKK
jgi:hypothetical protein